MENLSIVLQRICCCSDAACDIDGVAGCFKCGEEGHISRDCPGAGTKPQGENLMPLYFLWNAESFTV